MRRNCKRRERCETQKSEWIICDRRVEKAMIKNRVEGELYERDKKVGRTEKRRGSR